MTRKKHPPEKPKTTIKKRTVGKRISRREVTETTINYPASIRPMDIFKALSPEEKIAHFEKRLAPIEEWAKTVIDGSGLPTDPAEEHISTRWYASEILKETGFVLNAIERGDYGDVALFDYRLGVLVKEHYDLCLLDEESKSGDPGRKFNPTIMKFVVSRLKKNRAVKLKSLLGEIPTESYTPIQIGRAKLFKDGERIIVSENRIESSISISSFPRYLATARNKFPPR